MRLLSINPFMQWSEKRIIWHIGGFFCDNDDKQDPGGSSNRLQEALQVSWNIRQQSSDYESIALSCYCFSIILIIWLFLFYNYDRCVLINFWASNIILFKKLGFLPGLQSYPLKSIISWTKTFFKANLQIVFKNLWREGERFTFFDKIFNHFIWL